MNCGGLVLYHQCDCTQIMIAKPLHKLLGHRQKINCAAINTTKLLQSCVKPIIEWFEIQSVKKKKNLYRNKKIDCFCTDYVQNNINCFYVKIQSLF